MTYARVMRRIEIELPENIHDFLTMRAQADGASVSQLVEELLQQRYQEYLAIRKKAMLELVGVQAESSVPAAESR